MANDILVRVGADITDFSRKMAESSRALSNFKDANKRTFESFRQVGSVVTGAGVAIATGLGFAVNEAVKFEDTFAGVRKTVDASPAEFKKLEQGFRDLSKEIPASIHEINAVGEAAGQLGIETDNILGFTRTMIDLGVATNMSADEAATSLARLANITQMPQTEFDRLGSTIVALGNNLATTESEIVEMGLRLAGAGSQIGMTEAEIMSFSAALSSVGIEAEAGGSAFSRVMVDMQLAAERGGAELDNFANVAGMSASEFKAAFEKDAAGAMISFIKGLATMEERGESAIGTLDEMGITEIRMRDALLRAAGASDVFTDALEIGTSAWEENTALTNEAEQRYETVKSKLQILGNVVRDFAISIGDALLPAVEKVIDGVTKLANWFNNLSDTTKATIAIFTAVAAAIALIAGPVLLLIGFLPSLLSGIKSVSTVFEGTSKVLGKVGGLFKSVGRAVLRFAGPVGIAISAVMLLASVIKHYWGPISGFVSKLWSSVTRSFKNAFDTIDKATNGWASSVVEVFKAWADTLQDIFGRFWSFVKESFGNGMEFLKSFFRLDLTGMINAAKKQFDSFGTLFSDGWEIIKKGMGDSLSKMNGIARDNLEKVKTTIVTKFSEIGTKITDWYDNTKESMLAKLSEWGTAIEEWFTSLPSKISTWVSDWGVKIAEGFDNVKTAFSEKLEEWGTSISEWFESMPERILTLLEGWRDALVSWTEQQNEENIRQFGLWGEAIGEWFTSIPERMGEWLIGWRDALVTWYDETKENVLTKLSEWGEAIGEWFASIPERISTWMGGWWSSMTAWYDETKGNILGKLGEWGETIANWFRSRPAEIYALLGTWWTKMSEWFTSIPARVKAKLEEWWAVIRDWFKGVPNKPEIKDAGRKMVDKVSEGNEEKRNDFITKLGRLIVDVAKAALIAAGVALFAVGREIVRDIIDGVQKMKDNFTRKATELIKGFANKIREFDIKEVGRNIVEGLISGVGSMIEAAKRKASELAEGFIGRIKSKFKTASPSKVTTEIGVWVGQGLINGMISTAGKLYQTGDMLANAALSGINNFRFKGDNPLANYFNAVFEDGDWANDWITHLPKNMRNSVRTMGKELSAGIKKMKTEVSTADIDISYATPSGLRSNLSSAVNGTVDVNARDDRLIGALSKIERRLGDMELVMDGHMVGKVVTPRVNENNAVDANVRRYFD